MSIDTINQILLPLFLFGVYLGIFCIIFKDLLTISESRPQRLTTVSRTKESAPSTKEEDSLAIEDSSTSTKEQDFPTIKDPWISSQEKDSPVSKNTSIASTQISPDDPTDKATNQESQQTVNTTDENNSFFATLIDTLNKRQLRKLCKPLGIQQKSNGVEKTAVFLKAEVKNRFKGNPSQVIEVIGDRLPELLPETVEELAS